MGSGGPFLISPWGGRKKRGAPSREGVPGGGGHLRGLTGGGVASSGASPWRTNPGCHGLRKPDDQPLAHG